jgi:glycosyltransferase involved in cell wall biosynthesis
MASAERENPLRVLHVIAGLPLGGAETLLFRLTTRRSAVHHEIVALAGRDWYSERLEEHGITVHHLKTMSPMAFKRLIDVIASSHADVVHTWMYRPNLYGGVCARFSGKPVVWSIHCSSPKVLKASSRLLARLGGMLARWIPDFIINCSAKSAEVHSGLGYANAPGAVIQNGYDPAEFHPDGEARKLAREELGIGPDTFLIGSLTRWIDYKDVPSLLRALTLASLGGARLRCLLIGDMLDCDNEELMQAARQHGSAELIIPLGKRWDVANLARAMDLHVLSSLTEAFPNVVAETMLSGTPNVVTDVGDAAMLLGGTGWTVPTSDPEKLAEAILQAHREWKDKPEQWMARRMSARKQVADNFGFERMAEAYEEVWRSVAKRD